jgi:hypothetical protein
VSDAVLATEDMSYAAIFAKPATLALCNRRRLPPLSGATCTSGVYQSEPERQEHRMRPRLLFCLAALLASRAHAQSSIPTTPVGRVLSAWLDAYHSGDSTRIAAFNHQYAPTVPPAAGVAMRKNAGDVELVKILNDRPQHVEFLLREKTSGNYVRGTIEIAGDPPIARTFQLRSVPPGAPPEGCKTFTDPAPRATSAPGGADPADVASEDAIVAALYASISGSACQRRDWDRFRSLFVQGGRLIPTRRSPDGKISTLVESPDEYVAAVRTGMEENGFFEHETARNGHTFGAITEIFSTYESRRQASDAQPFARGINSIQLLNDGTRWWVVTVYWQGERPDLPIPAQYLQSGNR